MKEAQTYRHIIDDHIKVLSHPMNSKDVDFVNYSSIYPTNEDFCLSELDKIKINDSIGKEPIHHLNMTIDNVSSNNGNDTPTERSSQHT